MSHAGPRKSDHEQQLIQYHSADTQSRQQAYLGPSPHVFIRPFFFSSRRRHTRLTCDWSSDVCSSDLGKGVCFDSGGLSLKPGSGMMGMKGDMGGAAAVTGTMMALATRKAKVNAVGVIGLVDRKSVV